MAYNTDYISVIELINVSLEIMFTSFTCMLLSKVTILGYLFQIISLFSKIAVDEWLDGTLMHQKATIVVVIEDPSLLILY
jgi:nucleoside permease NupC